MLRNIKLKTKNYNYLKIPLIVIALDDKIWKKLLFFQYKQSSKKKNKTNDSYLTFW